MKTAIIIPAFNEALTISAIVSQTKSLGEVIVVDDASSDDTGHLAVEAGADVVPHPFNKGYDNALQSGFERAAAIGADAAVTFDADGQHDPAVLEKFITPLMTGQTEMVIGIRPQPARVAEGVFGAYTKWRFGIPDILCGLKSYSMALYHRHGRFDGTGSIGTELALVSLIYGARATLVDVPISPRTGTARFGSGLGPNLRILRAMGLAIGRDISAGIGSRQSTDAQPKRWRQ
ncbi:MAG: glycosyltransferase family 2 protein [Alphaproteobacteria bacterium]|nr:glycosyltransferase family 2 protein [Alphaproteobacteria bacterium]MBT5860686.1 glycosyltransferase family 2 protein [Alphaproteobacteria bacterium]